MNESSDRWQGLATGGKVGGPTVKSMASGCEPSGSRGEAPTVSVVICAHNEEQNIAGLVAALQGSDGRFSLCEIVCVASGCTDATVPILNKLAQGDPRVRTLVEPTRTGKASALSLGLGSVTGELIVIENADTLPDPDFLREVVAAFQDPEVKLVCGRPVPVIGVPNLSGRLAVALWTIHDEVCMVAPNAGEAYALRAPTFPIPADVFDDDTYICFRAREDGGKVVYARSAIIYNRAPETLSDYVRQRFRIHQQAAKLRRSRGYHTSTKSARFGLPAVVRVIRKHSLSTWDAAIFTVLEVAVIGLAAVVSLNRRDMSIWSPIRSTKRSLGEPDTRGARDP